MHILPKKQDIDRLKAQEKKIEIDTGLSLARSVDRLRESKLKEEKQLLEWRTITIKTIQQEIDQFIEERDKLEQQNHEARNLRNEMLKPLDKEWAEVNQVKMQIAEDKQAVYLARESLKEETLKIESKWNEVSETVLRIKSKETKVEKAKSEAIALKDLAQREYDIACEEHETHKKTQERELAEIQYLKTSYENGLQTNESKKQQLEEKESELINKEIQLQDREQTLERELQRNGH